MTFPRATFQNIVSMAITGKPITTRKLSQPAELEKQVRELSLRLINAQERERRKVGRDLHDRVGGSLTLLKLAAHKARQAPAEKVGEALVEIENISDEIYEEVRTLSYALKPDMLDELGLVEMLPAHFEQYTDRCGIKVSFHHTGLEKRLPAEIEITAFRIIQEALVNVARHAATNEVTVRLACQGGVLHLQVQDEGRGFDPAGIDQPSSGISDMQDRAYLVGGLVTVDSSPGAGTCVSCELPLTTGGLAQL
jgi:signal transduction histidine kinase